MRLEGIIAAIPTPFHPDETLNLEALESNVKRWNDTSLNGYTVLGTTGEFVSLTPDEKKQVLERAREATPREKVFVAGTGAESTFETISLTRWAAALGADYAIVVTPHYNRRGFAPQSLVEHYHRIADASGIPIVVYHIPACTGLTLEPATIGKEGYPLLLQTGGTADGRTPLLNQQYPSDLLRELAAIYSVDFADDGSLFAYFGFPGEPVAPFKRNGAKKYANS